MLAEVAWTHPHGGGGVKLGLLPAQTLLVPDGRGPAPLPVLGAVRAVVHGIHGVPLHLGLMRHVHILGLVRQGPGTFLKARHTAGWGCYSPAVDQ